MSQSRAPLWEALCAYRRRGVIPFHTPGHKLSGTIFPRLVAELGLGVFASDPSDEVESEEFGHDFEQALDAAQDLAAELFGAAHSLFLVNGTTSGIHYLLYFAQKPVVIPRFSHVSVYTGVMLSNSEAVYLPVRFDPEWQIPLPPTPEELILEISDKGIGAAVFTHPTYYGTCGQLPELTAAVQQKGAWAFVDEAHGGHFQFSPFFPASGLSAGADGVVQSTHKTLGSLTQTSMLHVRSSELYQMAKRAKQILETTSPSLVFLGVLDEVRRTLFEKGRSLVEAAFELALECYRRLGNIRGVRILPPHLRSDPTKVVFSLRDLGITGIQLEGLLRREYNIQVELSDYYNVIALITLGDTKEKVEQLCQAVEQVAQRARHLGGSPLGLPHLSYPALPAAVLAMGEAVRRPIELVSLKKAVGRVSGGFVTPYPPGVPVLVPGELVTAETASYLEWCWNLGWQIRGVQATDDTMALSVIKDNAIS